MDLRGFFQSWKGPYSSFYRSHTSRREFVKITFRGPLLHTEKQTWTKPSHIPLNFYFVAYMGTGQSHFQRPYTREKHTHLKNLICMKRVTQTSSFHCRWWWLSQGCLKNSWLINLPNRGTLGDKSWPPEGDTHWLTYLTNKGSFALQTRTSKYVGTLGHRIVDIFVYFLQEMCDLLIVAFKL